MAIRSLLLIRAGRTKTYTVGGKDDRGLTITKIKKSGGAYELQCKKADGSKAGNAYIAEHSVTEVR